MMPEREKRQLRKRLPNKIKISDKSINRFKITVDAFFCGMKNFIVTVFLFTALSAAAQRIDGSRTELFLIKAEASLANPLPLDEDLLHEFQTLTAAFDRMIAEESPETVARFFDVSRRIVLKESEKTDGKIGRLETRRKRDRLAFRFLGGGAGLAAAGAALFGGAAVPYSRYTAAVETSVAVRSRKETVACLVPAGICAAAAGGLFVAAAVLFSGDRPQKTAFISAAEEKYRNIYLHRSGL